jgi:hypothetical protein
MRNIWCSRCTFHAYLFFHRHVHLILPDAGHRPPRPPTVRTLTGVGSFARDTLKCVGPRVLPVRAEDLLSRALAPQPRRRLVVINVAHAALIALGILVVTARSRSSCN